MNRNSLCEESGGNAYMSQSENYLNGLTALVESSFPRQCTCCGKLYQSAEQFLSETHSQPSGRSSLKEALEEDGTVIVEVFRNCSCGSTLMDEFSSRRDDTEQGKKRRDTFTKLMDVLQERSISQEVARAEIIKILQGKHSDLLDLLRKD